MQVREHADVFQEVDEAVDETVVTEVGDRDPGGLGRVVAGMDRRVGVEDGDSEVEDDEVLPLVEAFDPSEELVDNNIEPGLFGDLAHDGRLGGLADRDVTAGYRPLPRRGPVTAADEKQLVVADGDGADGELGSAHRSDARRDLCMMRARAVKPCSSKKFFAAR